MNELMYNFLNQIEDPNIIKEMTVEEFAKLVKSNKLISDDDAEKLIESFKKIANKKDETSDSDSDQRKKKYREQHKNIGNSKETVKQEKYQPIQKENDKDSLER